MLTFMLFMFWETNLFTFLPLSMTLTSINLDMRLLLPLAYMLEIRDTFIHNSAALVQCKKLDMIC